MFHLESGSGNDLALRKNKNPLKAEKQKMDEDPHKCSYELINLCLRKGYLCTRLFSPAAIMSLFACLLGVSGCSRDCFHVATALMDV